MIDNQHIITIVLEGSTFFVIIVAINSSKVIFHIQELNKVGGLTLLPIFNVKHLLNAPPFHTYYRLYFMKGRLFKSSIFTSSLQKRFI